MIPTLLLFSLYLLLVGHDQPGGGFAGGLVGAAALLLVYLGYGDRGVRRILRVDPEAVAGFGLVIAVVAGLLGMVVGESFLEALFLETTVPGLGKVKLSSVLLFDTGVYLVVVGLVATGIVRLGGEERL
jgi:multicomponent Na+:H+ antiporter subunit B